MYRLVQEDATTFLREFEPESIDLLITDPAYASLEKHRAKGTTTRLKQSAGSSNVWFPVVQNSYFEDFFDAAYRALKRNTHFYVYCDDETSDVLKPMGVRHGFRVWNRIIWDKMKIGMGYHFRSRYEVILFFEKGKRNLLDKGMPNVLDFESYGYVLEEVRVRNGYPTEKPVGVSKKLILQSSVPGELVVDPFMGSGSVGEAAIRLGRSFAGSDITDRAFDCATERLSRVAGESDGD